FGVFRGSEVLVTRSLAPGVGLIGEVKRNLALYAGLPRDHPSRDAITALYIAGDNEHAALRGPLEAAFQLPVYLLDPLSNAPELSIQAGRGGFTGALGLLQGQAEGRPAAINFAQPKEAKTTAQASKTGMLVACAVPAAVLP